MNKNLERGSGKIAIIGAVSILIIILIIWFLWNSGNKNNPSIAVVTNTQTGTQNSFFPLDTSVQNNKINSADYSNIPSTYKSQNGIEASGNSATNTKNSSNSYSNSNITQTATQTSNDTKQSKTTINTDTNSNQIQQYADNSFVSGSFFSTPAQSIVKSFSGYNYSNNNINSVANYVSNTASQNYNTSYTNYTNTTGNTSNTSGFTNNTLVNLFTNIGSSLINTITDNTNTSDNSSTTDNTTVDSSTSTNNTNSASSTTSNNTSSTTSSTVNTTSSHESLLSILIKERLGASTSTTNAALKNWANSGSNGSNKSNSSSNSSSQSDNFGGSVSKVTYCTCSDAILLDIDDVRNNSVSLLYSPGQSKLYANYNVFTTGPNVLGTYTSGNSECQVYVGEDCESEGNPDGTIDMIGTSQN